MNENVLVIVGAGSTVFTPGLLRDLAHSRAFDDFTVRLFDINHIASVTMAEIGQKIATLVGSQMKVEAISDRKEALKDARFVTTTIAVGGAEAWSRDLRIPATHGVQQTVGDSVGPGGVLRALRQIPAMIDIAHDIEKIAPSALLINYSNPMTAIVRAVTRETKVKTIGLCHGTMHSLSTLQKMLGLTENPINATFAGLNHLCWLLNISSDGVDLYPKLREQFNVHRNDPKSEVVELLGELTIEMTETFGLLPAPGDRHVTEFFAGYIELDSKGSLRRGLQPGLDETIRYIGGKSDLWESLRSQASGKVAINPTPSGEAERLVSILETIVNGPARLELAINVPNDRLIDNLPATAVVEVPGIVSPAGIRGQHIGRLPDAIAAVLSYRVSLQELTVNAALSGSRELALQAILLDPLVGNVNLAHQILDDAVAADPRGLASFEK